MPKLTTGRRRFPASRDRVGNRGAFAAEPGAPEETAPDPAPLGTTATGAGNGKQRADIRV